jgi:threonine/homoserine/homoserine lactone efflux protein
VAHDEFLALLVFSLIGSFTPGPNTIVASATGATFGLRATLPHVVGVPLGLATMLLAAAAGVAGLIAAAPGAGAVLHWLGIAYMAWLSIALARRHDAAAERAGGPFGLPLGVMQSALFQYLNPKAWMLALAITGTWLAGAEPWHRALIVIAVFGLSAAASLVAWGGAGAVLRRWLADSGRRRRLFDLAMASALGATTLWLACRG